ncbi:MAG: CocE/NonD family hydrolase [Ignavibacteriae bacterium]|nr:CocE/NonD family hydrolase [Ignavibacteriota bacterium]
MNKFSKIFYSIFLFLLFPIVSNSQTTNKDSLYFARHYSKQEVNIPMRDGVTLFTAIYSPKNKIEKHPILLWRTPYSIAPYGENKFPTRRLSSYLHLIKENYIIVFQDVRGKFMSEGTFVNMRPYIPNKTKNQIDESSDAFDTIEWLINNTDNNNGNVGVWGISYPGFYAAMSAIDAHPALKAVSPQAPIADWFIGDDMHHNGAFSLLLNFNFFKVFGINRTHKIKSWPKSIEYPSPDAYNFFLELGSLKNVNLEYFKTSIAFWDSSISHPNYDYYWQTRNTLPHFKNITPSILTVGGWFDGEDLFGTVKTYQSIKDKNPHINNSLVLGPWPHGGWARSNGENFGDMSFDTNTGKFYRLNIELPFFNKYLKDKPEVPLPEAYIFETGTNQWHSFSEWPPKNISSKNIFLQSNEKLSFEKPINDISTTFDEYVSNPKRPVPYTAKILDSKTFYNKEYLVEDQRFASSRSDVLVYESEILKEDLTLAGPINVDLFVSTSGTDCDWVVKVIDVFPDGELNPQPNPKEVEMGGYQMLVRGDIFRSKFRNSFENPEPMIPNKVTEIKFNLNDVCHTFLKGHKIMIQIQSSWFPLFDRNPQTFVNIYNAKESDFRKATQRVYHTNKFPSKINFNILN